MTSKRSYLKDHGIGALLAVAYVAILLATAAGLGYSRDEGFYFQASTAYANWFDHLLREPTEALSRGLVDAAWSNNREHPSFAKSVFGLSWLFLYKKLHLFAHEGTSFRFGGMLFAGAGLWIVHIWGTRARSRACGLMAALLFAAMPRVFYHAHLDCFDIPITVMWLACAYAYWRAIKTESLGWAIVTGLVFGLALETKHNSWYLPAALGLHYIIAKADVFRRGIARGYVPVPTVFLSMAVLGPLVLVGLWPWLWFDTFERFGAYVRFHLNHDYYNIVFLGETYWHPPFPWSYVWVMTAATVPTITLVLACVGLGRLLFALRPLPGFPSISIPLPRRDDSVCTAWLWAIGLFVQYGPWIASRSTPIFGGTKHWMPAYPFLCLFAGAAFELAVARAASWLEQRGRSAWTGWRASLGLGTCVFLAPLVETAHAHPWGLSNYTPLVGGASGAATLGLNRQFWGFTTGAIAPYLNKHVKFGQTTFIHDTAWQSWDMLLRDGTLLGHVHGAGAIEQSDFALYHHEEHMEGVEYQIWAAYGTSTPVHIGSYDGVPIVYVYQRPKR